jgi:hypothetical protein
LRKERAKACPEGRTNRVRIRRSKKKHSVLYRTFAVICLLACLLSGIHIPAGAADGPAESSRQTASSVTAESTPETGDQPHEIERGEEMRGGAGEGADSRTASAAQEETPEEVRQAAGSGLETEQGDKAVIKNADGIELDSMGLPVKGLLIKGQTIISDGAGFSPAYLIKINPCGEKAHNTQFRDYYSSSVCCMQYLFRYNKEEGRYLPVSSGQPSVTGKRSARTVRSMSGKLVSAIESYVDTGDLAHCFYAAPGEGEVAAFIPAGIETDSKDRETGYFGDSGRYCIRYEAAAAETQRCRIRSVRSLDETGDPVLNGQIIGGGYLQSGTLTGSEHKGPAREFLSVETKAETGGRCILCPSDADRVYTRQEIINAGLLIRASSLPEESLLAPLMLTVTVPEQGPNGESGFGFCSASEYRKFSGQYWKYLISKSGGMRLKAIFYSHEGGDSYRLTDSRIFEATSEKPGELDLSLFPVGKGDLIAVIPYGSDYGRPASIRVDLGSYLAGDEAYNKTARIPSRFYEYSYELGSEDPDAHFTAEGKDGTKLVQAGGFVKGSLPVSDRGDFLQEVSFSMENGASPAAGRMENGLPAYGAVIADPHSGEEIAVVPDEADTSFAIESYELLSSGRYELRKAWIARLKEPAMFSLSGVKDGATVFCIRPFLPAEDAVPSNWKELNLLKEADYERKNAKGEVVYPRDASFRLILEPFGSRQTFGSHDGEAVLGTSKREVFRDISPGSWKKGNGRILSYSMLHGFPVGISLKDEKNRFAAVIKGEEETVLQRFNRYCDRKRKDGLPENSLVFMNRRMDEETADENGVDFHVTLQMPKDVLSFNGSRQTFGFQDFSSQLYRRNKDGTFEQIEPHDQADWVNLSAASANRPVLSGSWSYQVHAHLKNDEAIVITPVYSAYSINWSCDMHDHENFDVLTEECELPEGTGHPTRHYFTGTFLREKTEEEDGTEMVRIATVRKNASGGKEVPEMLQNVRPLKVDLIDYDFGTWHDFILDRQKQDFRFRYDPKNVRDLPVNKWYDVPYEGILRPELDETGEPQFRYLTPFEEKGVGLFDRRDVPERENGGRKTVYPDVDFDFTYDPSTKEYSYYSGLHAAVFDREKGCINQYDKTIGIDGWGEKGAGFLPFNSFTDPGVWGKETTRNRTTYLIDQLKDVNYHFGLTMKQEFIVPEGGSITVHNEKGDVVKRKDMVFTFSGDDDAWLFIDGRLVLDMGGIHEAVQGEVNLTKGTCTVTSSASPWYTDSSTYTAPVTKTYALKDLLSEYPEEIGLWDDSAFAAGTKHTFSFFYLERGGTLSDLSMSFNLPVFKQFSVTKQVEPDTHADSGEAAGDEGETFDFTVSFLDADGNPYTGKAYRIEDGRHILIRTEEGRWSFKLKDGEKEVFAAPEECVSYTVEEKGAGGYQTVWKGDQKEAELHEGKLTDVLPSDMGVTFINKKKQEPLILHTGGPGKGIFMIPSFLGIFGLLLLMKTLRVNA